MTSQLTKLRAGGGALDEYRIMMWQLLHIGRCGGREEDVAKANGKYCAH